MICTFFGHRNTERNIEEKLRSVITNLIEYEKVDTFYIGNNGNFDLLAQKILKELKNSYQQINFTIVLAYMPIKKDEYIDYTHTIYPDELAYCIPKFSIIKRNEWMIEKSNYVITYVKRPFGGAYKFKLLAEKKNKIVINLADEKNCRN